MQLLGISCLRREKKKSNAVSQLKAEIGVVHSSPFSDVESCFNYGFSIF